MVIGSNTNGHRFQQDNDPKHKSKMAKEFMEDNGINWWNTTFWCEKMTKEQCNLYIDHIYKVAPVCVVMNGTATGHLPDKIFRERSRGKSFTYFSNKMKTDPDVVQRLKGLQLQ